MNLRERFFGAVSDTVSVTVNEPPPPEPIDLRIQVTPTIIELGESVRVTGDYAQGQDILDGYTVTLYANGTSTGLTAVTQLQGDYVINYTPPAVGSIDLHIEAEDPIQGQTIGFGFLSKLFRGQATSDTVSLTVTGDDNGNGERVKIIDLILEKIAEFRNK